MFSDPAAAIYSWLSQLDDAGIHDHNRDTLEARPDASAKRKRQAHVEMTTPPSSGPEPPAHPSPKKRKVGDGDGDNVDPDATPRSDRSYATSLSRPTVTSLPERVPLSFPSASSATSDSQDRASDRGSRSSTSPVKKTPDLCRLEKPVVFASLEPNPLKNQLPQDAHQLYSDIFTATKFPRGIYPQAIRALIEDAWDAMYHPEELYEKLEDPSLHNGFREDDYFDYLPVANLFSGALAGASIRSRVAHAEYYKICAISEGAKHCKVLRRAEASWNAKVHEPLLELAAMRQRASVSCENATSARILPCFLPSLVTGETARGKMVDFVLAPKLETELESAIQAKLAALAAGKKSPTLHVGINQTDYTPLTHFPAAVSVETRVAGGNLEEGLMQLSIWTAAWHKRMEALGVAGKNQARLPTLPLILTHEHQWSLYFAVDRVDKIEVCGPLPIGTTDNLLNIYALLPSLSRLMTWIDRDFRFWFDRFFGSL
ncbi:hypothetical protein OQA88_4845 [Cercophora sp. LCS_1]